MKKIILVSFAALTSTAAFADAWTCQGICGYVHDGSLLRFETSPFTLALGTGPTAGEAYNDALAKCDAEIPARTTKALLRQTDTNVIVIGTISNSCVKN